MSSMAKRTVSEVTQDGLHVKLVVEVSSDKPPIVRSLTVSSDPNSNMSVTGKVLRSVRVEEILRKGIGDDVSPIEPLGYGGPTRENLIRVRDVYLNAMARGVPPLKTVIDIFGMKRPTASVWVRRLRDMGELPPPNGVPHAPGIQAVRDLN